MKLPVAEAAARLLAIGGSAKRGTSARGFRGVGRLAGLAYARQLIFRTRSAGDTDVLELTWDCLRLKAALREVGEDDGLPGVLNRIVSIRARPAKAGEPDHFFEVELGELVRHHRRDALLNPDMVADYLSEVAPVPLAEGFPWREQILQHLAPRVGLADLDIRLDGGAPLRRPFGERFSISDTAEDSFMELELLSFDGRDDSPMAVGWLLHHHYLGALPDRGRIKGLRLRCGNVQVGEAQILESAFPEPRFNSWTVGEIHVLDPRIVPNARRDNFELNVHYADLTAQVEPIARRIAKRCRTASVERNRVRGAATATAALASNLERPSSPASLFETFLPRAATSAVALARVVKAFVPVAQQEALLDGLSGLSHAVRALKEKDPVESIEEFVERLVVEDPASAPRLTAALEKLVLRLKLRTWGEATAPSKDVPPRRKRSNAGEAAKPPADL